MTGTFKVNTESLRTAKTHYDSAHSGMSAQKELTASGFGVSSSWAQNICRSIGTDLSSVATAASDLGSTLSNAASIFDTTDREVESDFKCLTSDEKSKKFYIQRLGFVNR